MRRRDATSTTLQALAAVAAVGLLAGTVYAVCGDANGDGEITVVDGVQALRAAAELSSVCNADCDVDGNGVITVADGVNILLDAAGLASVRMCPDDGDRVASLIGHTLDIFGPLTKIGAVGPAGTVSPCDNPEGGFEQTSEGFVFDDCVFGDVSFSGFLATPGDGALGFSNLRITRAGDELTLAGTLFRDDATLSGQLDAATPILGAYVITFEEVVSDGVGETQSGALAFALGDANLEGIAGLRVTLTGTSNLPVVVTFTDDTSGTFNFNVDTEALTPVPATPTPTPTPPPVARVRLSNIDDRITAFLNGQQVLQAQSGPPPNGVADTGFVTVPGLVCGDNVFEFTVENTVGGSGYTYRVQLEVGGSVVIDRACGQVGVQGCNGNDPTQGEVVRDRSFVCVPCGPCTGGFGTCANPIQIPASGRITIHGRVQGANGVSGPCGGAGGPESVFRFTPPTTVCLAFSSCGTAFDSQLSVGDELCPGPSGPVGEFCADDNLSCPVGSPRDQIVGFFGGDQPITVLLDSEGSGGGDYTLDVRPSGECIL